MGRVGYAGGDPALTSEEMADTAEQIRLECIAAIARVAPAVAEPAVDALIEAGLLATQCQQVPGHGRFRYVTAWQDPEGTA